MFRFAKLFLILSILVPISVPLAADAELSPGLGLSPTSQELSTLPGSVHKLDLTVINDGPTDISYTLYASDYKVSNDSYQAEFTDASKAPGSSAAKWFSFGTNKAIVHAHDQIAVPVTITVPKDASVGGHYAAMFAESALPPDKSGSQINRVLRVGSIFYIAVGGDLHQAGSINKLKSAWIQYSSPVKAQFTINNTGNVHFNAESKLILKPLFGTALAPVLVKGEVLPGLPRTFSPEMPVKKGFGLFQVTLSAKLGGIAQPDQHIWVLVIPILAEYIFFATLLVIAFMLGVMYRQRRNNK